MANPRAFLTIHRQEAGYRPVEDRIDDFSEVEQTLNSSDRRRQASRCMDCGVPFCHWACPIGNKQPEWQDFLYKGQWKEAYQVLEQTCDFPEFTGRVCPALCRKKLCTETKLRRTCHHPRKRSRHRRSRLPRRLYPTTTPPAQWQTRCRSRKRPRRAYRSQSTEP